MNARLIAIPILAVCLVRCADAEVYSIPPEALGGDEFAPQWGDPEFERLRVSDDGVSYRMAFSGEAGIGDAWPMGQSLGLGWDPELRHYSSLLDYDGYALRVSLVDAPADSAVWARLYMNTGLIGPSGYPSNDPRNDTWWGGRWVRIAVGESAVLLLDFDRAQGFNIVDNTAPHTAWDDPGRFEGMWTAINERDRQEVDNIGFVLADFDNRLDGVPIVIDAAPAVPEPATSVAVLAGLIFSLRRRHRGIVPNTC